MTMARPRHARPVPAPESWAGPRPTRGRRHSEQAQADRVHAPAPDLIAEPAGGDEERREREAVARDDPFERALARPEIGRDRRRATFTMKTSRTTMNAPARRTGSAAKRLLRCRVGFNRAATVSSAMPTSITRRVSVRPPQNARACAARSSSTRELAERFREPREVARTPRGRRLSSRPWPRGGSSPPPADPARVRALTDGAGARA